MKTYITILLMVFFVSCKNETKVPPLVTADSAIIAPSDPMIVTGVDTDDHNIGSAPTNTLDSTVPVIKPTDTTAIIDNP